MTYETQVASDVDRDGLGVELLHPTARPRVIAEIFRSDRDKTIIVNTFGNAIPLLQLERLISIAKARLDPFEDGTPLSQAR